MQKSRNDARRFLIRYKRATEQLIQAERELERLRADAESMSINLDGLPHGNGTSDRVGNVAAEIADYSRELYNLKADAIRVRREVFDVISSVPDANECKVLYALYIDCISLSDVARKYNRSRQWASDAERHGLDRVAWALSLTARG